MSLKNEKKKIRVALVLEMIGRPAEYLTESMNKILEQMKEEKGVEIISKEIKEPTELKDNKEFFSTFAEVEVEVEEIAYLAILIFKYMPAHIEVIEPELVALTNNGWNDILNEIARRLHGYDEVARVLHYQNAELQRKLKELMPKKEVEGNKKEKKK